jgi:hypothetical protein
MKGFTKKESIKSGEMKVGFDEDTPEK